MGVNKEDWQRENYERIHKYVKPKDIPRRLDALVQELPVTAFGKDNNGQYVVYCEMLAHEGIVKDESECDDGCKFKTKLYLPRK